MFYIYVLRSHKDGKRYIGYTSDLERRITEHQQGKVTSTKNRHPLELIYTETFEKSSEARARELFLKTHSGRRFLDSINK